MSGGVGAQVKEDFAGAVAAAASADVAIVAIGTMACGCCKHCGNGEVGDRMSLEPEGQQLQLVRSLHLVWALFCATVGVLLLLSDGARLMLDGS